MRPFVHLHCHSHYSLLDGASPLEKLVDKAKATGMNALAITDHGNLYGALQFYRLARAAGINPIVGFEAYVAPGSRFQKDSGGGDEASYHLTLLAQNRIGFQNLIKLSSAGFLEGFYRKPRIDKELLAAHSEGLICLSGCVSGEFSRAVLRGEAAEPNLDEALQIAAEFQRIFGPRYYIEIQNNGLEIQRMALEGAVEVARRLGLPLVATSDAHYVNRDDAEAQDVLLCINTGRYRADTKRMRMEGDQFYLRSPEEMYATFVGLEEAVARSQEIADGVSIELELGKRHFPTFAVPDGQTSTDYLRRLCEAGLRERYAGDEEMLPGGELAPRVRERLDRELRVIDTLGFANYFLIVWDFVRFAREQNIPASARGSGVGSLVAFALQLSHVCPLRYDLLFERFLDENRREAPDIDIDFCKDRRGEVLEYVKQRYGAANVAQIGTFGTLAAKAAIRDVGRVLNIPLARVDQLCAMVPEELKITLDKALAQSDELRKAYESDREVREWIDFARKVEGLARNVGTHAAGVVIADRPLTEYVPLQRITGKEEVVTQWEMEDVEAAGLLKMDFLGLRNLTILAKSIELIEQSTGQRIDPYRLPLDDAETFALLCRGETKGIFQLEGGGIRDLLQQMKPDHFRDIIATNALWRPGPIKGGMLAAYIDVKHGRKQAQYLHPVMREILEETHGVMVYQEQVMRILNRLGGIELSNAYTCIKAISKKKHETIAKYRSEFVAGASQQGLTGKQADELFGMIEMFAGYGFNKSHSTAYALIAYVTAYLKAHWPVEFMAALLSGDVDARNFKKKDSLVEHLEDCRRMGIVVEPPDVNAGGTDFTVADGRIRFSLAAIKGVGRPAAAAIAAERAARGPFLGLFDFCGRVDPTVCNRAAIESLVKSGAFDFTGAARAQLAAVVERALQAGASQSADRRRGQRGLFEEPDDGAPVDERTLLPKLAEWDEKTRLAAEKEVLGFYLSSHPLAEHLETFRTYCTHTSVEAPAVANKTEVLIGGMLGSIKLANTKQPSKNSTHTRYAMFDLEDMEGIVRSICWPEEYARIGHLIEPGAVLVVRGTIEKRVGTEEITLIVNELIPLEDLPARYTRAVLVRVDEQQHGPKALDRLFEVLRGYPGKCELQLLLALADGPRLLCAADKLRVEPSDEMRARVLDLLGTGCVKYLTSSGGGGGNGGPRPAARPQGAGRPALAR